MSTRRFSRPKSIPALLRLGQTDRDVDTVSERFLSAVGVARSPETVASPIIDHLDARADHVLVSAFGDLDSIVDQLEQLPPHSPTRSRAEPRPKAVALRCYRCSANVFSTGDVRRRVNGATHTTRMTNPIRASTATTPTIATNSGCIWTDTTGGSSDLPFSTKAAAPQPWSRAPAYHLGDEPLAAGLYPRAEWLWLPARNAFHGVVYRSRDSGCGSRGVE
jgi:hypothetical protein